MQMQLPLDELQALFKRSPAFGRVYLADLFQGLGEGGLAVLFPLLMLAQTHDLGLAGLAFTGEILAFGLMSPVAGWCADRFEPRRTMQLSLASRALVLGCLWLLVAWGGEGWGRALFLSVLLGALGAFFVPARAAYLRRLLAGADLDRALALEGTTHFLLRVASPALYGLLLAWGELAWGLGATILGSLLALALLASTPQGKVAPAATLEAEATPWQAGWQAIAREGRLRELMAVDLVLAFSSMAGFSMALALLDRIQLPPTANAWLLATTGLAGALGTLLAPKLPSGRLVMAVLLSLVGLGYLLAVGMNGLPGLMLAWALRGLALGALGVRLAQGVAHLTPAALAGRVQAAWALACCLACALGSLASPWLLSHGGPARAYLLLGALAPLSLLWALGMLWPRKAGAWRAAQP